MIAGVLLAAGSGRRFGGEKLLARLADGTPLAVRSARLLRPRVDRGIAVVRPGDSRLGRLLAEEGFDVVPFPGAAEGMGASLAFGVSACREAEGWVVALADMPFVLPATIERVVERLRSGVLVSAPCHLGERGHPVGFSRSLLPELLGLGGDAGARAILARHAPEVELFETDDRGVVADIDDPGTLEKEKRREGVPGGPV